MCLITAGRTCLAGLLLLVVSCSEQEVPEDAGTNGRLPEVNESGVLAIIDGCVYVLTSSEDRTVVLLPTDYSIDNERQLVIDGTGSAYLAGETFVAIGPRIAPGSNEYDSRIDQLERCGWPGLRGIALRSIGPADHDDGPVLVDGVDLSMLRNELGRFLTERAAGADVGWAIGIHGDGTRVMVHVWNLASDGEDEVARLIGQTWEYAGSLLDDIESGSISTYLTIETISPISP